jgi:hypothetical protein
VYLIEINLSYAFVTAAPLLQCNRSDGGVPVISASRVKI